MTPSTFVRLRRAFDWVGDDVLAGGAALVAFACGLGTLYGAFRVLGGAGIESLVQLLIHAAASALLIALAWTRAQLWRSALEARKTQEAAEEAAREALAFGESQLRLALEGSQRSELFLKALIGAMPYPVWVKDTEHRWLLVNDAFARRVNMPREELIGKTEEDVYSADLASRSRQEDAQALSSPEAIVIEDASPLESGDRRWWLKTKFAFSAPDGARYIAGFAADITRLKEVENSLREGEARFRSLTQLSSDWFWEQDDKYRFTFLSSGLIRRGIDPQTYLGRTRWELSDPPEDDPEWRRHKEALEARRPFFNLRLYATTISGVPRLVSANGEPVFDADNQFVGYRGVARDLTDVVTAQNARRDGEERLRAVYETVMDGIVMIDDEGTIQSVNPATCRIFDYAAGDMIHRNITMLIPERYREAHAAGLSGYRSREYSKLIGNLMRLAGRRRDGSEFPLDITITEMRVAGRLMFAGTIRDVTSMVWMEEELGRGGSRFSDPPVRQEDGPQRIVQSVRE